MGTPREIFAYIMGSCEIGRVVVGVRFLHVADLHIGKRVNSMSMLDDQRYILDQIVSIAKEKDIAALVVAGDIYDKASPSAEAVTVFDAFLSDVTALGVHVLAVPGNHDSAERIAYAQGLLARQGVCFPPVFDGTVECVTLDDDYGPVKVWLLPFLKPGDVRRFFPQEDIGDDYSVALRAALSSCDVDKSERNIIVSHQFVTAAGVSPERADDEIKLGGIDNVDVSVYEAFDYVALGHVHRPQRVGRDTARYAGSPLKYSFGEARYDKSAVLVDVGKKERGDAVGSCVSFELIPLNPLHDMRELRMTLDELVAEGASLSAACEDYVHVTLTAEYRGFDAMLRVREVFPNVMTLDFENASVRAAREQVRSAVDPDEVDTLTLFAQFYEEQKGNALDDVQERIVENAIREIQEASARGDIDEEGDAR